MENILITGGLGFVGRHLTKRLLDRGHTVTIVDNMYDGSGAIQVSKWMPHLRPTIEQIKTGKLKIRYQDCRDWFKGDHYPPFDKVFHLAAVVGGRLTIENDPLAVAIDLSIDAEFFHWLSRLDYNPKVYYFSSSAAYPIQYQTKKYVEYIKKRGWSEESLLLNEYLQEFHDSITDAEAWIPDMTYGWAKLTGEFLARYAHKKYGLDITCFRPFSGYGEDQDLTYPFPSILKRVMDYENPVTVWGSGQQERDFIYIEDCIDGILHLGEKIHDGSAVNLSTGRGVSFNQLAQIMLRMYHVDSIKYSVINTSDKPEGVFKRVGSTRLQGQFGFKAKTTLEEGIMLSMNHIKNAAKSISSNSTL